MVARPQVAVRRIDSELVLLNFDNECYYGLDEVGTRMWEVLTSAESVAAAVDQLLAEYDIDAPKLNADVAKLVRQLTDNGLVELRTV